MAVMKIKEFTLTELIQEADSGKIMLPGFQRDYVWDTGKISSLLLSLFKARPVGMATSWLQPENSPHTPPIRFSLKDDAELCFGSFSTNPAVTSLVLDGRQRITTLLHVFTKNFYPKNSKYSHANRWFLNLKKKLGDEESVFCVKINKLKKEGKDTVVGCLARGIYPLDAWSDVAINTPSIFMDSTYAADGEHKKPGEAELKDMAATLQAAYQMLMAFKLPIAEISEKHGLSDVCEIFEILNTTGTRVSVFDLIHTNLFQHNYDLRAKHVELSKDSPGIYIWGAADPVYYSQLVTATWNALGAQLTPTGRDGKKVEGIKAGSLLNTVHEAYEHFGKQIASGKLADALKDLYVAFGGRFSLQEAPYPVSLTLFFALYLACETTEQKKRTCALFRAFYFRNALLKRYTEGYLTKYSTDMKFMYETVRLAVFIDADFESWAQAASVKLTDHLANGDGGLVEKAVIEQQLLADDLSQGAQYELYTTYLLCRHNRDLLTGNSLDILVKNPHDDSVEIHHLYPRQWLKNNNFEEQRRFADCFANKVPLTRASNNFWRDKAPNTVLAEKKKTWSNSASQFDACKIGSDGFAILTAQPSAENIDKLWKLRAQRMANDIYSAQSVDFNGFE